MFFLSKGVLGVVETRVVLPLKHGLANTLKGNALALRLV